MNPLVKNSLAVLWGILCGGAVNYGVISLGAFLVASLENVALDSVNGINSNINLYSSTYFMIPLLGHGIGTLVGACVTAKTAQTNKSKLAIVIGLIFLYGGITLSSQTTAPIWFSLVDLTMAYIPMAWLGNRLSKA